MARSRIKSRAMPGWVKVFIGLGVAVLAIAALAAFSGHGPWQHLGGMHP
ncbi:hypothetical protein LJR016_003434 [Devosia sp. LjRoot16]|jgi:hypothetical protein